MSSACDLRCRSRVFIVDLPKQTFACTWRLALTQVQLLAKFGDSINLETDEEKEARKAKQVAAK